VSVATARRPNNGGLSAASNPAASHFLLLAALGGAPAGCSSTRAHDLAGLAFGPQGPARHVGAPFPAWRAPSTRIWRQLDRLKPELIDRLLVLEERAAHAHAVAAVAEHLAWRQRQAADAAQRALSELKSSASGLGARSSSLVPSGNSARKISGPAVRRAGAPSRPVIPPEARASSAP
jgi:hypothetical protein